MESKKLTREEIDSITSIQTKTQEIQNTLGVIAFREIELSNAKQVQNEAYNSLREEEAKLAKKLEDKYGSGNIDLNNGVFTPHPAPAETV
jgi:hypothetical protein